MQYQKRDNLMLISLNHYDMQLQYAAPFSFVNEGTYLLLRKTIRQSLQNQVTSP